MATVWEVLQRKLGRKDHFFGAVTQNVGFPTRNCCIFKRKQYSTAPRYLGNQEAYGDWVFAIRGFLESEDKMGLFTEHLGESVEEDLTLERNSRPGRREKESRWSPTEGE